LEWYKQVLVQSTDLNVYDGLLSFSNALETTQTAPSITVKPIQEASHAG
jgi:hypothetical protein